MAKRGERAYGLLSTDALLGFQNDGDARDFRDTMRERVEMLLPPARPRRPAGTLRGVLKELAELHGFDGYERAERLGGERFGRPIETPELDRLQIDRLVAQARMNRARQSGSAWARVAASVAKTVRWGLHSRHSTARPDTLVTCRYHPSEA